MRLRKREGQAQVDIEKLKSQLSSISIKLERVKVDRDELVKESTEAQLTLEELK